MNLPAFFSPLAAWLFLLVAPLVVLYFLKLKRPRQEVPSLVLWRQVLNDNRVNSPFQRFKKNLLLLLQLILLALLIFAAMQPYLKGNVSQTIRLPILLDHSASMAAVDKPGGMSRLERAKLDINTMIDGLHKDQQICLIAFADNARKLCDFTNNKRELRKALDKVQIEDVGGNIEQALRLATAVNQTQPFEEATLMSDGNFPAEVKIWLPFGLKYERLPVGGPNYGITLFNARRSGQDKWDVLVRIEGSWIAPDAAGDSTTGTLVLIQDGQEQDRQNLVLAQAQAQRLMFSVSAAKRTSLELRLQVDGFDSLSSDNVAYLDLEEARKLRVFCPVTLPFFRRALTVNKDVELLPSIANPNPESSDYDLVVTDQEADLEMDVPVRFFANIIPGDVGDLVTVTKDTPSLISVWRREAEVLRYVNLIDRELMDEVAWNTGVLEGAFVDRGYEVIVHGNKGPLMLRQRDQSQLSYYLMFDVDRSTLPYYGATFPILVTNVVNVAMDRAGLAVTNGMATGVMRPLKVTPDTIYTVNSPGGLKREAKSNETGRLSGVSAPRVGRYRFEPEEPLAAVGVSMLSPEETALMPTDQIVLQEQSAVTASTTETRTDYAYWRLLVILAFCVLALEWWYFNRKVGGFFGR